MWRRGLPILVLAIAAAAPTEAQLRPLPGGYLLQVAG